MNKKTKYKEVPIVYIFQGDKGLVLWMDTWPQDMWETMRNEEDAKNIARFLSLAGISVHFADPNIKECLNCGEVYELPTCPRCRECVYKVVGT